MIKLIDIGTIILSSGILLLCYLLFMRKERYHQLNRFYLLLSLLFSSLLPFLRFQVPAKQMIIAIPDNLPMVSEAATLPFGTMVYAAGALLFFILFLFKMLKVLKQVVGKYYVVMNGLKVIHQPAQKAPFSFFRYVVVDIAAFESDELDLVLRHEAAHAKQWHTIDILFVELAGVVCWFNPFVWVYKSALKSLHEYVADESVLHSNTSRNGYFDLILKQIRHQNRLVPVHSFSAWAVKSRIRMMMENKTGRHRWLRYLPVVPLVTLLVVGNSLLASSENVPSFMENIVVPAVVSPSFSEHSDVADTVPPERGKAKRAVRQAKPHSKQEESVSQLDVLESQSWLATQYGDPVEFHEETPATKQEVHYTVRVVCDDPQVYQVTTKPKWVPHTGSHPDDAQYPYPVSTPEKP